MTEFEVQRRTRHCAKSGEAFQPGEFFFSALFVEGAETIRRDFSIEAWKGPPEEAIGWWKTHMPLPDANKTRWAPNDVMLDLFTRWASDEKRSDIRFVLTLLLIRRRVFRQEDSSNIGTTKETMAVYCPRNQLRYEVPVVTPSGERAIEIQEELGTLLFAGAE